MTVTEARAIPNYDPGDNEPAPAANGHRTPPHDLGLEAALIGAALLDPTRNLHHLETTAPTIYSPRHRTITDAILTIANRGDHPDAVIVNHHLTDTGHPDNGRYLVELQSAAAISSALPTIARQLTDLHQRRQLIGAAHELDQAAHTGDTTSIERWKTAIAEHTAGTGPPITWEDVGAAMRGETPAVLPSILQRTDGQALIYPGLLHWLMGEPGKGKTWVALHAVAEQLALERHVIYLDWEGNRTIVGDRLNSLGITDILADQHLHYWRPPALRPAHIAALTELAGREAVALVVCDGAAKAIARQGLNEDKAPDVLAWLELLANPLTETGAAVLMLDHVTKDKDGRGLWARGSGAKQGEVSGAAWSVKPVYPFSRTTGGRIDLIQAKDREGRVGVDGSVVAVINFMPADNGDQLDITVKPPVEQPGGFRPTHLMELVSKAIETANEDGVRPTTNDLMRLVKGDKKFKGPALSVLIDEDYVGREPGPNRSLRHYSKRPYRAIDDPQSDTYQPPSDDPHEEF